MSSGPLANPCASIGKYFRFSVCIRNSLDVYHNLRNKLQTPINTHKVTEQNHLWQLKHDFLLLKILIDEYHFAE